MLGAWRVHKLHEYLVPMTRTCTELVEKLPYTKVTCDGSLVWNGKTMWKYSETRTNLRNGLGRLLCHGNGDFHRVWHLWGGPVRSPINTLKVSAKTPNAYNLNPHFEALVASESEIPKPENPHRGPNETLRKLVWRINEKNGADSGRK
jgi:hypothetical protein